MSVVSDVEIRLRADIARLQQDMTAARRSVDTALNGMSASAQALKGVLSGIAAGLSVGAFVSFIKNSIDAADALNDMSARTKVAIEDLAGLAYAAKLGDTSLDGVAASISKLGQNIGKDGAKFRELGITATEPLEAFKQLADVFKDIKDPQQRAAFGAEALGKSWQEAAVLLEGGSAGIETLMNRGKELSGVTEQVAADAGKFNDGLDTLGFTAQGVGTRIAAGLLPMLNVLVDDFTATGKGAETAAGWVTVLSGAFKTLYTVGVTIVTILSSIGKAAGAAAAITVAALSGDFKGAIEIYKELASDVADGWVDSGKRIAAAWTATSATISADGEAASATAAATAAKVAGFLNSGDISAARKKAAADAEAAAKKEQSAYSGIVASIKEKMAADQLEIAGGAAITPIQQARIKLDQELAAGKITLTDEHIKEAHALLNSAEALEKNAAAAKQVRAAVEALADERSKNYAELVAEAVANEKLAATFGKTKKQIEELTLARDEDRLAQRGALELSEDTVAQLEIEIDARKRNIAALGTLDVLEAQKKATDAAAASQVAFWKSIDDTAHDTFVSIANGSKDTAQRLKDTFKNVFFDWLYQQTIKKWIINIGTASSGGVGDIATALGGGSSGSGSSLGSAANLLSIGKTIYNGFYGGVASSLGGAITTLGNAFGSQAVSAFGTGMSLTTTQAASAAAAYGGTGTAVGGGLTAGASAASAIPIIGWIITGMMASKGLLAQGWDSSNGSVSNLGRAAGGNAAIWSDTVLQKLGMSKVGANILSGQATIAKMFGRKNPEIESQGLRGTLTATGSTDAENYVNILQKGGWFRSDKRWSEKSAASSETDKLLDDTTQSIVAAVKSFGSAMGIEATAIDGYSKVFDVKLTGDATKDTAAITALFTDVGNELALRLVPGLAAFAAEGETASTTLQRLATDYVSVNNILATTGQSIKLIGVAGIEARENLIKAAGGLDALASGVSYFQQNFLTTAQQLAPVQKQVTDALAAMGMSAVKTNEQFAAATLGIDLSTQAGAELYVKMLALAPAFKTVTDAVDALQKQAAAAMVDAIHAMYSDVERAVAAQKDTAAAVLADTLAAIDASISSVTAKISNLTSLSEALRRPITAVTSAAQEGASRGAARADILAALAIAKSSGVLPTAESLAPALTALSKNSLDNYGSMVEYLRDQAAAGRDIAALGAITDTQLSVAQRSLSALELQRIAAQANHDQEIARLDGILEYAKQQVALATGESTLLASLPDALTNLASAIAALGGAAATNPYAATAANTGKIQALYNDLLGRPGDAQGIQFYLDELAKGTSWDNIKNGFLNSPEFLAQSNGNTDVVRELQALNTRMANVEANTGDTATHTSSSAGSNAKLAQQFDTVSAGGSALLTEAIPT